MERYRARVNHFGAVHHNERAAAVERCVAGGIEINGHITGVVGTGHLIDFYAIDGIGKGGYLVVVVEYLAERIPVIGVERMGCGNLKPKDRPYRDIVKSAKEKLYL